MKRVSFIIVSILIFITIPLFGYAQGDSRQAHKLIMFYSPSCHECMQIKNEIIPDIKKKFKGQIHLEFRDITDIGNYKLLLSLQEKYSAEDIKNVQPIFYLAGHFLSRQGLLKRHLESFIVKSLNEPFKKKLGLSRPFYNAKDLSHKKGRGLPSIDLVSHFKALRPFAIISAGLIDGINPCAFTVIVFFMSFLTLQGYRKKELMIIGLSFILAVFLTYILVGIGIFGFLYRLSGLWLVAKIFNLFIAIFSIVLGFFCLYDFFKFKKTKSTEGLLLQLPGIVKNQIHSIIGLGYRKSKETQRPPQLVLGALITGFLVSILESVCTGQVYLPTIAFVLKTTSFKLEALGFLLLYNLMFILPLLVIFLFAFLGVTSEQFAKVLRKHLLSAKMLMAVLFFALGIFLIWRA